MMMTREEIVKKAVELRERHLKFPQSTREKQSLVELVGMEIVTLGYVLGEEQIFDLLDEIIEFKQSKKSLQEKFITLPRRPMTEGDRWERFYRMHPKDNQDHSDLK